jgi:hypothetical protein
MNLWGFLLPLPSRRLPLKSAEEGLHPACFPLIGLLWQRLSLIPSQLLVYPPGPRSVLPAYIKPLSAFQAVPCPAWLPGIFTPSLGAPDMETTPGVLGLSRERTLWKLDGPECHPTYLGKWTSKLCLK